MKMNEEKVKIWKDFWRTFGMAIFLVLVVVVLIAMALWHYYTKAAIVNGSTISRISVIRELESESGESMLDALVTKKLIAQKAAEAGIKIDSKEVDAYIKDLEDRIASQGSTLDVALAQQGISMDKFREQVTLQKALEKLLADKVSVSDEEVDQYIASNKLSAPEGVSKDEFHAQVKEQLVNQKLGTAAQDWIAEQKKNATIKYFVPYAPKPVPEMTSANPDATPAAQAS